jgi:hypothetical protein
MKLRNGFAVRPGENGVLTCGRSQELSSRNCRVSLGDCESSSARQRSVDRIDATNRDLRRYIVAMQDSSDQNAKSNAHGRKMYSGVRRRSGFGSLARRYIIVPCQPSIAPAA